jgi:hypothetical protein
MATLKDDEFLKEVDLLIRGKPNDLVKTETPAAEPAAAAPVVETPPAAAPVVDTAITDPAAAAPPVVEPAAEPAKTAEELAAAQLQATDPAAKKAAGEPAQEPAKTAEQITAELAAQPAADTLDYKALFSRIVGSPIRAGGKDITIANVDEAISLIQKGVGFHGKMNRVQADLKLAEMLKSNNITQEQLNLLIDAHAGKPGAIKKLLDSAKIDPLTLDSPEASNFAPSDHSVSDAQIQFQSVVTDLTDSTSGQAILRDANGWDQGSKAEIFKTPDVLTFLAHQKESGVYDKIKEQVERGKMVGTIPPNESFLVSYTRVGQQLQQAGQLTPAPAVVAPTPTPVAQKVLTPTPPANAQRAAAAAPTKTTSGPSAKPQVPNTRSMNDDEFMKSFRTTFKI